ncbi:hypothetical protein Vadar_020787 [Vaccinium darrowii]|uniref:Uncharacterized protein n=1 Tax=Vaccinium darrowii TaxID=229202 RepID=A0ACB7YXE5_9ERIC|nr:hypothetical protein Vadar_020787 [Vaccinium darrowii]
MYVKNKPWTMAYGGGYGERRLTVPAMVYWLTFGDALAASHRDLTNEEEGDLMVLVKSTVVVVVISGPSFYHGDRGLKGVRPDVEPIAAIGIEIWTMQDGILFGNILIATTGDSEPAILDYVYN